MDGSKISSQDDIRDSLCGWVSILFVISLCSVSDVDFQSVSINVGGIEDESSYKALIRTRSLSYGDHPARHQNDHPHLPSGFSCWP